MTNMGYHFYIGIDVSKAKLDGCFSESAPILSVPNDEAGYQTLFKHVDRKKRGLIVLEATGGYERGVANYLRAHRCEVAVVNAKRVRDFAKATGTLAKTDAIDARIIRHFASVLNPKPQKLASKQEQTQEGHVNRRAQLVRMIATEKQQLEHAPAFIKKSITRHIRFLETQVATQDRALKKQCQDDPVLNDNVTRLKAIPGVGDVTALAVITHLPELGTLTPKAVASLAGLAPFNRESGQKNGKREITGGRAPVRSALYMAILTAIKHNPRIKKFYDRLIQKGKMKKVAMVACMRKLIIIMNAMLRDTTCWRTS